MHFVKRPTEVAVVYDMSTCWLDSVEDRVVEAILLFAARDAESFACTKLRFAHEVVPSALASVVEAEGFVIAERRKQAKLVYRAFVSGRTRFPLDVTWRKAGIDAEAAVEGVAHVERLLARNKYIGQGDSDRRILCVDLSKERPATLRFLGDLWSIRLAKRGAIRARNARASRLLGTEPQPDDDELSLEVQLLPLSRCYPNCNCRYYGELHVELLRRRPEGAFRHRNDNKNNNNEGGCAEPLRTSCFITGCYTCMALDDPAWHDVYGGLETAGASNKLIVGVQCASGWAVRYSYDD